jgi:hypothetical protein
MRGCQGSATTLGDELVMVTKMQQLVFALAMTGLLRGCLKSPANAKFTDVVHGHASSPEAEVSTYSTEFDGSQDFSNTLLVV